MHRENERIATASELKGRRFIATLVLGDGLETTPLRAFLDLHLRRSSMGRWLIAVYYRTSPAVCRWLERRQPMMRAARPLFRQPTCAAAAAVQKSLMETESVPFLSVLLYTEAGLAKRAEWEATWALQRRKDAIDTVIEATIPARRAQLEAAARNNGQPIDDAQRGRVETRPMDEIAAEARQRKAAEIGAIPVPPKYKGADFPKNNTWRLRGALDVPKERFVAHPGASFDADGSLVVIWAGFDHLQQATVLANRYLDLKDNRGWPPPQVGAAAGGPAGIGALAEAVAPRHRPRARPADGRLLSARTVDGGGPRRRQRRFPRRRGPQHPRHPRTTAPVRRSLGRPEGLGHRHRRRGRRAHPHGCGLISRPFDHGTVISYSFDHGTVISYSFDSSNWQATRYSDGVAYGVWYGALDVETTVLETAWHWYGFVTDSYPVEDREIVTERRVFEVRCDALLIDLRGKEAGYPDLVSRESYAFTQQIGRYVHEHELNGLLARSARCDGTAAAIFKQERLSNMRDRAFLTYRLNAARDSFVAERTPGRKWIQLAPSSLE